MGILLTQSPEELRSALAVQLHSELRAVSLLECNTVRDEGPIPEELALSVAHSSSWAIEHPVLRVTVEVRMRAKAADDFLSITARHLVEYGLADEYHPADDAIDAFSNGNAVFNVWPYARELFAGLTSRMGLQLPPLPFLRIVPPAPKESPVDSDKKPRKKPQTPRKKRLGKASPETKKRA